MSDLATLLRIYNQQLTKVVISHSVVVTEKLIFFLIRFEFELLSNFGLGEYKFVLSGLY